LARYETKQFRSQRLAAFAAYPLIYKGQAVAVLAMFSKKKLSHVD